MADTDHVSDFNAREIAGGHFSTSTTAGNLLDDDTGTKYTNDGITLGQVRFEYLGGYKIALDRIG
ncbi:hypothetical protein KAR91_47285, partial [Candidatus Pacearchaeota archaeon]|nr:hypothetical protein [Candidatus Pacearchaeota archaeon]